MSLPRPRHATVVSYLALALAASGTAYAATGGTFLLGKSNGETSTAVLSNSNGVPLQLNARKGSAPLGVNNSTKVRSLNADLLDGLDSAALQRVMSSNCPAPTALIGIRPGGAPVCRAPVLDPILRFNPANAAVLNEATVVTSKTFTAPAAGFYQLLVAGGTHLSNDAQCNTNQSPTTAVATLLWDIDGHQAIKPLAAGPTGVSDFGSDALWTYLTAGTHTITFSGSWGDGVNFGCDGTSGTFTAENMHAVVLRLT